MPNNRKTTLKKIKGNSEVHPGSRKAAQITRVHLRKAKLVSARKDRKELKVAKLFRPNFFLHQVTSAEALTLPELRSLVTNVFLTRNDARIAELESERRAGRAKVKEHVDLEELKRVENSEWETGFEVVDLTDPKCTRLMSQWAEAGTRLKSAHVDLLPWVRIARGTPEVVTPSRPGQLAGMGLGGGPIEIEVDAGEDSDAEME